MDILEKVVEVSYVEIISVCLLCVTLGLILAMVIEEFKKQRYENEWRFTSTLARRMDIVKKKMELLEQDASQGSN